MVEHSKDLAAAVDRLEEEFWVSKEKLKEICDHFQSELDKGLQKDGGSNIPMNVTWVTALPTGRETGEFLTVDLGGTNIRVCWVELLGHSGQEDKTKVRQHQYQIEEELKTGDAEQLWDYVAESIEAFIKEEGLTDKKEILLGFTFSYPATQERINHGVLQTWTKGFDVKGVEGENVVAQLEDAMKKKELPVRLVALVNDTTGALIASHYNDPDTIIGAIFGTGCNAAYMESNVPKLKSDVKQMAINCEYGAFDNDHKVLPRTKYDVQIDKESPRPEEQAFEKMSAGLYLGEIYRLILLDLHEQELLFVGQDMSRFEEPYALDTGFLSGLEDDEIAQSNKRFQDWGVEPSTDEMELLVRLAEIVTVRGARLCACGVGAIVRKQGLTKGHIAADGSVANKHPKFKDRWSEALGEILSWKKGDRPIIMTSAEDGSGVGAAIISALVKSG